MSSNLSGKLKIEHLGELHSLLAPVAYAYKRFGSQIQVESHILLEIEQTNCDFSERLYKVLEHRLKQLPLLTWHDIVRALRSPAVHEEALALEIESQYIPCSSSQSQLASLQSSTTTVPDSGASSPAQAMQHQYFPNQLQCYFPTPIHPPHQWLPQHRMHPPPPQQQVHLPYLHPQMYPPPTHHPPIAHPQMHPSQPHIHPQLSHPQHPPSLHPEAYPSPPHPQMYQYPNSGSSQSFMKPKLSVNPPVILSQPLTGRDRKRSSFEQVNVSSQAGSVSAQPRSFGLHSWQSQPLMAAAPFAKRHCVQSDPLLPQPYCNSSSKALFNLFVQYLKILYRSSPLEERTEVLKLRTPGKMFINLACINRKTEGLRTEYDEITEAMVRDGNVDVIEGRKCPIDMNEIAANLPSEAMKKVILVEGAPGVGKSTFAWEFCRRWERGEIAQQYDLVLLLRLRDDRINKAKCLKDLIYHHSEMVRDAVVSELESCLGVNVLLLLEGYDELPDECRHRPSVFLELINGQVLPLATILITSRPWATCDVRKKFEHRIFQHIEVLGFTKEQITSYIRSTLSEEEALDLEEHLQKQSTVRTCMYIPLNCAIVVKVYLECKANGVALPTTLSGFYETVSFTILLRYLRAIDISSEPIENFHNLPAALKSKFCSLCQLAYDSIAGAGDQVKLIFTDLPIDFDGLGFMDSVFELYETRKAIASHNFLHLTFQEFLAAVHISNMEVEQQLQHYKRHKDGRLRVVLRFLAGITKLKDFSTPSSFSCLLDQPRKCGYTAIDYTIRPHVCTWVYEVLGKEIMKTAFHEDITVEFSYDKLSESAALGYCIAHSCCKWVLSVCWMEKEEVDILVDESRTSDSTGGVIVGLRGGYNDLDRLGVSFTELNIFTGLHIRLSELAVELRAKCSQMSWPDLSSLQSLTIDTRIHEKETILELDYLLPQLSLSSLTLQFLTSLLSFEDSKAVANYITNSSTLKYLHILVYYPLIGMDEIFAAMIEKEVRPNFTLESLYNDEIDNDDAEKLANYIRTTALSKLVFPCLTFSAFGALQVARALRTVPDLKADKLYFCITKQSDFPHAIELINDYSDLLDKGMQDDGNVCFSFLLPDSTTSVWGFDVDRDVNVDDVVVEHLVEAVHNNSLVQALGLCCQSCFSDVGAKALVEAVNCNTTLEELELNKASIVSVESFTKAFGSNTALKKLVLKSNDIGDAGAEALAEVLSCNTFLEKLDLTENEIGNGGAKALAQAIKSNTALKKLVLKYNCIGDAGAEALAEVLSCNTILEKLDLTDNEIGNCGAKALAQAIRSNIALKKLVLKYNCIGDVGARALAEVLSCNTILDKLDLTENEIGNGGAEALAQSIRSNTALKKLVLSDNNIGDAGAEALAEVLSCNTILEKLDLTENEIGNGGAEALAQAIRSNTALKKLVLKYNDIGDAGAEALAEVLSCNTLLEKLDLTDNEIGNGGAKALAQAIRSNTALKKLVLSDNNVGDVGAIPLAQALHSNSSLEFLDLQWNCIGDHGAKAFAEALHHNSAITHLDLSGNRDIGEEGVHHLIQALTVNDSISENGLTLDRKGSKCALNYSGYRNVEHKIKWW